MDEDAIFDELEAKLERQGLKRLATRAEKTEMARKFTRALRNQVDTGKRAPKVWSQHSLRGSIDTRNPKTRMAKAGDKRQNIVLRRVQTAVARGCDGRYAGSDVYVRAYQQAEHE